ncbi:hypothetical protein O181_122873, partial [Austropuccinia psidii MF-1]|nr:hypothetical protein [Austropuccinia psidii MF-1]
MKVKDRINSPRPSIARIRAVLALENNEILLDSGATHSVVGDVSLFTDLRTTDMRLSVASSKQFNVGAIGRMKLKTKFGTMMVDNVLYCSAIPGIVLSIGQLIEQGFDVKFDNGLFKLTMGDRKFFSHQWNFCWFIAMDAMDKDASIKTILVDQIPPPINFSTQPDYSSKKECSYLWHQRMGHLSIRNIKRLL